MRTIIVLALSLLVASAASAIDWQLNGDNRGNPAPTALRGSQWATFDPTANDSDTNIINMAGCENATVKLSDDKDGDSTVCTVTYTLEFCPNSHGAFANDSVRDAACNTETLTGVLSGDAVERGWDGVFMRLRAGGSGANAADCRLTMFCAQPSSK